MESLTKILKPETPLSEVVIGEIYSRGVGNTYTVKIGARKFTAVSLVSEILPEKTRVVIVRSGEEVYITNREKIRDKKLMEVVISG